MKIILQIHAIIESLAGFVLLLMPQWLLASATPELQGIAVSKLYGILALCFGITTYIISTEFQYNNLYKKIILVIIGFHVAVGLYMYSLYDQNITHHIGAASLHIILAILFLIIYLQKIEKFNA